MVIDSTKLSLGFARLFRPMYAEANMGHPSGVVVVRGTQPSSFLLEQLV
jgi:hypothetical protein